MPQRTRVFDCVVNHSRFFAPPGINKAGERNGSGPVVPVAQGWSHGLNLFVVKLDMVFSTLSWFIVSVGRLAPHSFDEIQVPRLFDVMKTELGRDAGQFGNAQNPAV